MLKNMNDGKLSDFLGGWLVGSFSPALFFRDNIEVGIKTLKAGFEDEAHYHNKSTEYNILIKGHLLQNGADIEEGSIFIFRPGEVSKTTAISDSLILVIRDGSGIGDKHLL